MTVRQPGAAGRQTDADARRDAITVTFVSEDGDQHIVRAQPGSSVMEAAVANGVSGITADCGGGLSCATCHVWVDESWREAVGDPTSAAEDDLLEGTLAARTDASRLSCQIALTPELDGVVVRVPAEQ